MNAPSKVLLCTLVPAFFVFAPKLAYAGMACADSSNSTQGAITNDRAEDTACGSNAVGNSGAGVGATAIGASSEATAGGATALGFQANASESAAVAVGRASNASATNATAIGDNSIASSDSATAIGSGADATGLQSTSIGRSASALGNYSTAIGQAATASADRTVAIGVLSEATADRSVAIGRGTIASESNSVALGDQSRTAAAVSTAASTINGSRYSFAGGLATGTVSVGSDTEQRTVTNVAAGRIESTSTDSINGSQLHATNQAVDSLGTQVSNLDVRVTNVEGDVENLDNRVTNVETDLDDLEEVAVRYDKNPDGSINYNSVTLGNRNGSTTVSNVARGVNGTDAVNVDQLNDAVGNATSKWIIGSPTSYVAPVSTGTDGTAVGSGSSVTATNSVAIGTGASATVANSVALGNGSTTQQAVSTAGGRIAGKDYTYAGGTASGVVSVGNQDSQRQLTNVAAGQVGSTSTDAVNGSQLHATNQAIEQVVNDVAELDAGTVHYDRHEDGSINYNNVTLGNGGGTTVISNVGPGVEGTDAVNVNQLIDGIDYAINTSNSYTDNRISQVQGDIWNLSEHVDDVERDMHSGIAIAMSLKQAPAVPGKTTYYTGVGNYKSQSAFGFSLRRTSDTGRFSLEGGLSANRAGTGIFVGVSGVFGSD